MGCLARATASRFYTRREITNTVELDNYLYSYPTRAELLRWLGRIEEAAFEYQRALELYHSEPERRFLTRRLSEICPDGSALTV